MTTMEGSASVRKSLSGTLVPSSVTTVALLQKPEEKKGKISRKVLDEEEYIEVSMSYTPVRGGKVSTSNRATATPVLCLFTLPKLNKVVK